MHDVYPLRPGELVEHAWMGSSDDEPNAPGWAALLEWCYLRACWPPPRLQQLKPREVPHPYRELLVHSVDMTPTLERFFGREIGLKVLGREFEGDSYRREVVLTVSGTAQPVLYGVIHILLSHLPSTARRSVESELYPLGHILQTEAIPHISWPQAFFRVGADTHIADKLGLEQPCDLFGRRNVLLDSSRRLLAEVIEVLAPIEQHGGPRANSRAANPKNKNQSK